LTSDRSDVVVVVVLDFICDSIFLGVIQVEKVRITMTENSIGFIDK